MSRITLIITLLIGTLLFAACGSPTPAPAPVQQPQQQQVAQQPEAQPDVINEPAPTPTLVVAADPTLIPEPGAEAEPTAAVAVAEPEPVTEPEAQPEETESSEQILLLTQADFASQNRNPLTGEVVENPADLNRRPILCKISNSPPEFVRPQSGLNAADIVFEHYTEGVITRFSALFYGTEPVTVGPVRSARLIDLELPLMYDAALCFSGGSSGEGQHRGVYQKVFDTQFAGRVLRTDWPGYYRTGDESRPYEHTFYNRIGQAWGKLDEIGQNQRPNFATQMAFGSKVPKNSAPASYISITHGKGTFVEWQYNEATGKYLRTADGTPVIDAVDQQQVAVNNVIILKAPHIIDRNICETQTETQCIAFSTEIQVWGGGFVSIFRDGRQVNGSWRRENRAQNGEMFTFFDDNGQPIPLQLGNSWIQVVPYEYIDTPIVVQP